MGIEVVDWEQSYDSDGSNMLVLTDAYEDETAEELVLEFNFSNAGCGDVDWEVVLTGADAVGDDEFRDSDSYDFNNYDFEIAYPFSELSEGRALATLNVTGAETCDDDLAFMSDQYEINLRETHDGGGGGGGGGDDDFTAADLDASCSIEQGEIEVDETAEIDVDLDGVAPIGTGPWSVPVDLLVDGDVVASDEGSASPNGASGPTFDITFHDRGEFQIGIHVHDPYE